MSSWKRLFTREGSESGQVNTSLVSVCFLRTVRRVSNDNYLRMVLFKSSNSLPMASLPVDSRLQAIGFQHYSGAEDRG